MTELALGIVSLAGLFTQSVESYCYIRLGQHYARDFERSQTKLDLSRLQLSRWGGALGLDAHHTKVPQPPQPLRAPTRGAVTDLLDNARIVSKRFEARNEQAESTNALNPDDLALHKKISSLVSRRLPKTTIVKKIAWALYGKNDLHRLVDDITELTSQLILLFPARVSVQKELCAEEVQEMNEGSLSLLANVAAEQDSLVAEAAHSLMQARDHTYIVPRARDGATEHNGERIHSSYRGPVGGLSHLYDRPLAKGKVFQQHNGNLYGGYYNGLYCTR